MRRRRILVTAVAATLAVAGLAACRTNVGAAARVDGHRIAESEVNGYLLPAGVAPNVVAAAKQQGHHVSPRSQILMFLIRERVFQQTLDRYRISVTEGELAGQHDRAGSLLVGANLTGSALDRRIDELLTQSGVRTSFRPLLLRSEELELLLVEKRKITTQAELTKAVTPVASKVSVSSRYGSWDPSALKLNEEPVLPSFVSPQPGA